MARIISSQSQQHRKRIEWLYQSNNHPWSSEPVQWSSYSDVETAIIEEAYQNKTPNAVLDDYHINFKHMVQISNNDLNRQRPVKRTCEGEEGARLREGRFFSNPVSSSKSFADYGSAVRFTGATAKYFNINFIDFRDPVSKTRSWIVERAAEGLIVEGKKVGKQREGEWLSKQLLNVKEGTAEQVYAMCARLYNMETFLYQKMNEVMRLVDDEEHTDFVQSKVPTFGLFVLLLHHLAQDIRETITVYRGAYLSDDSIEQYRQSIGEKMRIFTAFTSTSRSRAKAEQFGNVLFEIDIDKWGADISQHSIYPNEEEVLLSDGFFFKIQSCILEKIQKKWIVRLVSEQPAKEIDVIIWK